ncbi:MAG TPA: DUF554 domain-containing protein [Epulopiscium sp.]|nr:DUF554 domain-containing protein [Candidatus Epulonipiscium sp.]
MGIFTGNFINAGTIIIGSAVGLILKGGIPENIKKTMLQGVALCVLLIGILGLKNVNNEMVVIISMVLGAVIGEMIDIDKRFNALGQTVEKAFKGKQSNIAEGFVTSSLLFCVGAMAITGALESGLMNQHTILSSKAILDGITSMIFASTMGFGVLLSGISVFIYQGVIVVGASFVKDILGPLAISDMTVVGSLLIIAIGFNMLNITKIKIANLLPAIFLPIIYYMFF